MTLTVVWQKLTILWNPILKHFISRNIFIKLLILVVLITFFTQTSLPDCCKHLLKTVLGRKYYKVLITHSTTCEWTRQTQKIHHAKPTRTPQTKNQGQWSRTEPSIKMIRHYTVLKWTECTSGECDGTECMVSRSLGRKLFYVWKHSWLWSRPECAQGIYYKPVLFQVVHYYPHGVWYRALWEKRPQPWVWQPIGIGFH